jgi:hypothetical protein
MTPTDITLEPLFDDDVINLDELVDMKTTADVTQMLRIINAIERKIEALRKQQLESGLWYFEKMKKLESQIQYFENQCAGFMNANHVEKLSTPAGSISIGTKKEVTWPDDATVIEWARQNDYTTVIKSAESINKTELKKLMQINGTHPPGYTETTVPIIRRRNVKNQSSISDLPTADFE